MPSAFHSSESAESTEPAGGGKLPEELPARVPLPPIAGPETASIEEALKELQAGRPLIVVDDPERENEGDLVLPASQVTPALVAFFIRHTSGILCTPIRSARAQSLELRPMVAQNDAPLSTAFTVSVDYRHGLTTGISAEERCRTILALVNSDAPQDFVRPGHIFPLVGREGGVLVRTGHTEAALDLARLAGLPEVGLLAELVNDDGSVKKGEQILEFARHHRIRVVTIADLVRYRQESESLLTRVAAKPRATAAGPAWVYSYRPNFQPMLEAHACHFAMVFGELGDGASVLVRFHKEHLPDDIFADVFTDSSQGLRESLRRIGEEKRGIIVYLRRGAVGVVESKDSQLTSWREIGIGAQILRDLGVKSIRLLAHADRAYVGLAGFGIEFLKTELLSQSP